MMFLANLFDNPLGFFIGILRYFGMLIIGFIYKLIAIFYNIFIYLTKVQILSGDNKSLVSDIYNRIQVILAVVMVFYVTLEFVKYIVNPETFSDKEKGGGGLLKRILIVIVLMAFTPQIFGMAYDLQNRIISSEVIPKVLIKDYDPKDYGDNAGGQFSSNLLSMFYKPYTYKSGGIEKTPEGTCGDKRSAEEVVKSNLNSLTTKGKMLEATYCIDTDAKNDVVTDDGVKVAKPFLIEVDWIVAIVVGGFMVWVLINYCAEAGRVIIQFIFLQIIAPVPILSYIAPGKDGMFNKWVKQCTTTYLDLFIRLFIMYLVMMLSQILLQFMSNGTELFNGFDKLSWDLQFWIVLFLIIGLLMFAMKAPKMVKELLPGGGNAASGDFGVGLKSAKERYAPAGRVAGAVGGALATGTVGAVHRAFQGNRGLRKKWKEADEIKDKSERRRKKLGLIARSAGRTIQGSTVGAVTGVARGAWNGGKSGNIIKNVGTGLKNQTTANARFGNIVENEYGTLHRIEDRARDFFKMKSRVEVIEKTKTRIEERSKQLTSIKTLNDDMRARAEKKLNENGNAAIQGAEKRLRDLKEDPTVLAKYTASKFQDQAVADAAFKEAQQRAVDGVVKQNFYDSKGNFDQNAYDEACNRARKSVDQKDYIATPFKTENDAKAALAKELEKAQKELKDIKDQEINKYIDDAVKTGKDQMIIDLKAKQIANVEAYNSNTSISEFKINVDNYKDLSADDLDKYVKGKEVSGLLTEDSIEISKLIGEQQKIKNEIDGSDISSGAKK